MGKLSLLIFIIGIICLSGSFYLNNQINQLTSLTESAERTKYVFDSSKLSISELSNSSFKLNFNGNIANITVLKMANESIKSVFDQFFIKQSSSYIPKSNDLCKNFIVTTSKNTIAASDKSKILVDSIECR